MQEPGKCFHSLTHPLIHFMKQGLAVLCKLALNSWVKWFFCLSLLSFREQLGLQMCATVHILLQQNSLSHYRVHTYNPNTWEVNRDQEFKSAGKSHLDLLLSILFLFFLLKRHYSYARTQTHTRLPHVSCLQRPEMSITSSAADLTGSCEASGMGVGIELKASRRAATHVLNH